MKKYIPFLGIAAIVAVFLFFQQIRTKDKITSNPIDLKDLNKAEVFKAGFKEFLKKEQLSIEIEVPNKYETILTGNLYTNHYFNISTDFPDNWKRDRGMSEFSVIRVFIEDSAMVIALIAIPANFKNTTFLEESHKNFQISPFAAMEMALGKDYKNIFLNQITSNTQINAYEFSIAEEKVRNTNYFMYSYKYNETVEGSDIVFKTIGYQTLLWGVSYTFEYTSPDVFCNPEIIESTIFKTNYIRPGI